MVSSLGGWILANSISKPLTALTDWILADYHDVDAQGQEYLCQLKRKATYLNDLSDSVIRYCEITADDGKEVADCAHLVANLLAELALSSSVHVTIDGTLPTVAGMPQQLKLLLTCLIENALQFAGTTQVCNPLSPCSNRDQARIQLC